MFSIVLSYILKTGDGTRMKPYVVSRVSDEYDILNYYQMEIYDQELIAENGKDFDKIIVKQGKWKAPTVWFDISDMRIASLRMFNEIKAEKLMKNKEDKDDDNTYTTNNEITIPVTQPTSINANDPTSSVPKPSSSSSSSPSSSTSKALPADFVPTISTMFRNTETPTELTPTMRQERRNQFESFLLVFLLVICIALIIYLKIFYNSEKEEKK